MGILITLLVSVIIAAIVLFIIDRIPIKDANVKQIIYVIAAVVLLLWILGVVFGAVPIPHLHHHGHG